MFESRNSRPPVAPNNTPVRSLVPARWRALWSARSATTTRTIRGRLMGRNLLTLSVALCAILLHTTVSAATPELQIAPRIGVGSLKVKQFVGINERRTNVDTFG